MHVVAGFCRDKKDRRPRDVRHLLADILGIFFRNVFVHNFRLYGLLTFDVKQVPLIRNDNDADSFVDECCGNAQILTRERFVAFKNQKRNITSS